VLSAFVWGLIQGLTEFLPISSSGHLVIIPALLTRLGFDVAQPELAVSAFLHLGTLLAVIVYFRADVLRMARSRTDTEGRRLLLLVAIGTVPAVIGLFVEDYIEVFQETVTNVGWALIGTGVILSVGHRMRHGTRALSEGSPLDALTVGIAQAFALIPGISRSGTTISAGNTRRFAPAESARFAFLLGIPAIAGAGILELPELIDGGSPPGPLLVGFLVAAVSGYAAIALLLRVIARTGLAPFAIYCLVVGLMTVLFL
jgi:undecaprenyl-diphosphatase